MARINYSALITNIVGKLAGTVFQNSYGGYQIHSKVSPRNPRTLQQQMRRGNLSFLSRYWRVLSPTERATWINPVDAAMQPKNFFIQSTVNLSLLEIAPPLEYITDPIPAEFETDLSKAAFMRIYMNRLPAPYIVPDGNYLVLQATNQMPSTNLFTNKSSFKPIHIFPPSSDFSSPVEITTYWTNEFGIQEPGMRIYTYNSVINPINGSRADSPAATIIF